MLSQNTNALGILFPNNYDNTIPEMVTDRAMASIPFGGRYRMIDFALSSMTNSGINNVSVIVRKNYHSLMDHLGTGREWDLARRRGGLNIWPPFADKTIKMYNSRVDALDSIMHFLEFQKERYVILSDTNLAVNVDYKEVMAEHQKSGADITMLYYKTEIPAGRREDNSTVEVGENGRVTQFHFNDYRPGPQNLNMNIYVMERTTLIRLVKEAASRGMMWFEREVLSVQLDELDIRALEFKGYVAQICSMKSYFEENMKLIDEKNLDALFPKTSPVYTKLRDDNPARYLTGSKVVNSLIADGCRIEGTVENCVLFRGVVVEKGAVVKNCVLMQDTVVKANADLSCVVTDKNVTITENKSLAGTESYPVYVAKRHTV